MIAIFRIMYVLILIVYAWFTSILGFAINGWGPGWFDVLCMLIGIGIFGVIGWFGLILGRVLARDKRDKDRVSIVYVVLVGYLHFMAIGSFALSILDF